MEIHHIKGARSVLLTRIELVPEGNAKVYGTFEICRSPLQSAKIQEAAADHHPLYVVKVPCVFSSALPKTDVP